MKWRQISPSRASIFCSSDFVPSVAATRAWVSPRVNTVEPWARVPARGNPRGAVGARQVRHLDRNRPDLVALPPVDAAPPLDDEPPHLRALDGLERLARGGTLRLVGAERGPHFVEHAANRLR